jgi:hypothetical protein
LIVDCILRRAARLLDDFRFGGGTAGVLEVPAGAKGISLRWN